MYKKGEYIMPKKRNYQFDNNYIKIYFAYYNKSNILLAMCEDKGLLKDYLEIHRKLNSMQYQIDYQLIEESDIYNKYENYMLSQFYNLCIPLIDIKIINSEYNELDIQLESLLSKIKYLSFLMNNIKKADKDLAILLNAINVIEFYKNKKYDKLLKEHFLHHPILTCNIDEYMHLVSIYREYIETLDKYKYICSID